MIGVAMLVLLFVCFVCWLAYLSDWEVVFLAVASTCVIYVWVYAAVYMMEAGI